MARPVYIVYSVTTMTGTAFTDGDVPAGLVYVGSCEAINGDHAREIIMGESEHPVLVLRHNTIKAHALKQ